MVLGIFFATMIVPGIFMWIGVASPSQLIAETITTLFGDPAGIGGVLAMISTGTIIVLLLLGDTKFTNKMEKSTEN